MFTVTAGARMRIAVAAFVLSLIGHCGAVAQSAWSFGSDHQRLVGEVVRYEASHGAEASLELQALIADLGAALRDLRGQAAEAARRRREAQEALFHHPLLRSDATLRAGAALEDAFLRFERATDAYGAASDDMESALGRAGSAVAVSEGRFEEPAFYAAVSGALREEAVTLEESAERLRHAQLAHQRADRQLRDLLETPDPELGVLSDFLRGSLICTADRRLEEALLAHVVAERRVFWKLATGFMPSDRRIARDYGRIVMEAAAALTGEADGRLEELAARLEADKGRGGDEDPDLARFNEAAGAHILCALRERLAKQPSRAGLLLYGKFGGAWLLTSSGQSSEAKVGLKGALARIRGALGVEDGVRGRIAPSEPGSARTPPREASDGAGDPLPSIADALIPPALQDALTEERIGRLIILPAGEVGAVPFALLPIGAPRRPLAERMEIVLASGLTRVGAPSRRRGVGEAVAIGDPASSGAVKGYWFSALPAARREALAVAEIYDGRVLIGEAAGLAAVRRAVREPLDLLHFATHGVADPVNPMDDSFLLLADGVLSGAEIKTLRLSGSPTVVMSACQTGLGKIFADSGVFGLARAWLSAGAATVVGSLWNVDDDATALLMEAFARRLKAGDAPETALRAAMAVTRKKHADPALWGAFVVIR